MVIYEDYDKALTVVAFTFRKKPGQMTIDASLDQYSPFEFGSTLDPHFQQHVPHDSPTETKKLEEFQAISYNIWNYNQPWIERLQMLGEQLENLQVKNENTIIAAQEVRYNFFKHWLSYPQFDNDENSIQRRQLLERREDKQSNRFQIEQLRQVLPLWYQYVYDRAMVDLEIQQGGFHTDEGLALFSSFQIIQFDVLSLSRNFLDHEDAHQRICQRVLLETPSGKRINVFNTHLSLSANARRRIVREIWNWIIGFDEYPQILMGDFNDEPDGWAILFLTGKASDIDGVTGDFRDSWIESNHEETGYTFPSDKPSKRIDFILYRGKGLSLQQGSVELIGKEPKSFQLPDDIKTVFASDHLGLRAKFNLL